MNIYRRRYGIPNDLMVRKPDVDIRMAVADSDALKKLESMLNTGIHPSLIFFEKEMEEKKIRACIAKIQGSP